MQNLSGGTFFKCYPGPFSSVSYSPVANDRVYAAFALYKSGLLDKEGLIKELKTYKLVDQMLFHTPKSLKHLRYIEVKEVTL